MKDASECPEFPCEFEPIPPRETQYELLQRRGRDMEKAYQAHVQAIEWHRANGTLIPSPYYGERAYRFDRRRNW
jgi:hypothetical protein